MNRLESELFRLYGLPAIDLAEPPVPVALAQGETRAIVLELTGNGAWGELGGVWRNVQADLGLPAPAIAVSGSDGMQLWFALGAPVSTARAAGFLASLRARYLPSLAASRLRCHPAASGDGVALPRVPSQSGGSGQWSAYVAPDLAPIFEDTPWLDVAPGVEAQADVLARLDCIPPAAFDAALQSLAPAQPASAASPPAPRPAPRAAAATSGELEPREFLRQVMNDATVDLALRIEAAKALLAHP